MLLKNHTSIAETTVNTFKNDEEAIALQFDSINDMAKGIQNLTNLQDANNNQSTILSFHTYCNAEIRII